MVARSQESPPQLAIGPMHDGFGHVSLLFIQYFTSKPMSSMLKTKQELHFINIPATHQFKHKIRAGISFLSQFDDHGHATLCISSEWYSRILEPVRAIWTSLKLSIVKRGCAQFDECYPQDINLVMQGEKLHCEKLLILRDMMSIYVGAKTISCI